MLRRRWIEQSPLCGVRSSRPPTEERPTSKEDRRRRRRRSRGGNPPEPLSLLFLSLINNSGRRRETRWTGEDFSLIHLSFSLTLPFFMDRGRQVGRKGGTTGKEFWVFISSTLLELIIGRRERVLPPSLQTLSKVFRVEILFVIHVWTSKWHAC